MDRPIRQRLNRVWLKSLRSLASRELDDRRASGFRGRSHGEEGLVAGASTFSVTAPAPRAPFYCRVRKITNTKTGFLRIHVEHDTGIVGKTQAATGSKPARS